MKWSEPGDHNKYQVETQPLDPGKASYKTPKLQVLGSITDLTGGSEGPFEDQLGGTSVFSG